MNIEILDVVLTFISIFVVIQTAILSFLLNAIKELRKTDKELLDDIHSTREEYVKKSDLHPALETLFEKLESLDRKLSEKLENRITYEQAKDLIIAATANHNGQQK